MKAGLNFLLVVLIFASLGCEENSKVRLRPDVGNASLVDNAATRPIAYAGSAILGEGVEINEETIKTNKNGLLELYIKGHNNSQQTKRFWYRPKWIDADGMTIESRTSIWTPMSVRGKTDFDIKVIATTPKATDVKIDTKKWE
ncbi:MAG: YcfL family protein [Oscillospiraceae bacterium]|jgi:uncharacterized protein YcfL